MARTFSQDLRDRVIAAVDGGMSRHAAAERFGVAVATAIRWVRAWRADGVPTPRPKGGDLRSQRIEKYRDVILAATAAQADITLVELSALLLEQHDVLFAPSTIWRFLDRHRMTLKKTAHACEQARPDVAMSRQAWFDAQQDLDPAHLVFIEKREPPPRWRASAGVPCADTAAAHLCRTGTERPPPSRARSGSRA